MKMISVSRKTYENKKGFTLLEVCIAMAVLAIALLGVTSMQINAVRNITVGNLYSQANTIANRRLEYLKTLDLTLLDGQVGSKPDISATPDGPAIFTRETVVRSPDDATPMPILESAKFCRWIEVTVSWNRAGATHGSVKRSVTVRGLSRGEGI